MLSTQPVKISDIETTLITQIISEWHPKLSKQEITWMFDTWSQWYIDSKISFLDSFSSYPQTDLNRIQLILDILRECVEELSTKESNECYLIQLNIINTYLLHFSFIFKNYDSTTILDQDGSPKTFKTPGILSSWYPQITSFLEGEVPNYRNIKGSLVQWFPDIDENMVILEKVSFVTPEKWIPSLWTVLKQEEIWKDVCFDNYFDDTENVTGSKRKLDVYYMKITVLFYFAYNRDNHVYEILHNFLDCNGEEDYVKYINIWLKSNKRENAVIDKLDFEARWEILSDYVSYVSERHQTEMRWITTGWLSLKKKQSNTDNHLNND